MDNLVVKNVAFCGAELIAVQEKDTGKIYVGINNILRQLGFNEDQVRYRRDKWSADKVISKVVQKFSHPSKDGGTQETYCMEIKRFPLALAKIEITPKMEDEMPDLSVKLEKYQDECADVLAAAFLPQRKLGRRKAVEQKEAIKFYTGESDVILVIGEDVYEIDPDDCLFLEKFESKLRETGVNKISDVLKAYVSVKFKKIECTSIISDGN